LVDGAIALNRSVIAKPACVTITTGFVLPSVTDLSAPQARYFKDRAQDKRDRQARL